MTVLIRYLVPFLIALCILFVVLNPMPQDDSNRKSGPQGICPCGFHFSHTHTHMPAPVSPAQTEQPNKSEEDEEETAAISGVVVSTELNPVSNAKVSVGVCTTETDAEGFFSLTRVKAGRVTLVVHHPDFAPALEEFTLLPDEEMKNVRIILRQGMEVSGRVVDEQGKGIEGAEAVVMYHLPPAQLAAQDTTDADGRFRIKKVPAQGNFLTVSVNKNGYIPNHTLFRCADDAKIDVGTLVLTRGLSISGRVTDTDGRPIKDAKITVSGASCFSQGETDESGFFTVSGLKNEDLRVLAEAKGYISNFADLRAGSANVSIVLRKAARLEVSLKIEDIHDYEVRLVAQSRPVTFERKPTSNTLIIEPIPPGEWRLLLLKNGRIFSKKTIELKDGETLNADLP